MIRYYDRANIQCNFMHRSSSPISISCSVAGFRRVRTENEAIAVSFGEEIDKGERGQFY